MECYNYDTPCPNRTTCIMYMLHCISHILYIFVHIIYSRCNLLSLYIVISIIFPALFRATHTLIWTPQY